MTRLTYRSEYEYFDVQQCRAARNTPCPSFNPPASSSSSKPKLSAGLEDGGKYFHLNFGVQDGRLWVRLSDQGEESAEWEGDRREGPIPGVDE